jgi:hypothetical protein
MGNALFTEDEDPDSVQFDCNLESPDADSQLNGGTAAPNCQPKHQADLDSQQQQQLVQVHHGEKHEREGQANGDGDDDDQGDDKKRQHMAASEAGKKLSYVQMAKLGYQELVNAIIRPPRADYKVRLCFV